MKIVRLYTGTDNESHFEDIDVELRVDGHMQMSALQPAHGIMFRSASPSHLSALSSCAEAPIRDHLVRTGRDRNR